MYETQYETDTRRRRLVVMLLTVTLAGSVAVVGTASAEDINVHLNEDGDARMVVEMSYDLEDDSDREAFVSLEQDEGTQETLLAEYVAGLEDVASAASNETGRDMTIENSSVGVEENGDVGTVRFTVDWVALAEVGGGSVRVTEPFSSGFDTDTMRIEAPEGYVVDTAEPSPNSSTEASATWSEVSFEMFEASPTIPKEESSEGEEESLPGFGIISTVVAVFATAVSMRRAT